MRVFDRDGNFIEPTPASICSTGIEVAAIGSAMASALPYVSAGMTVLGGIMGASAQQQQGDAIYRNALLRNQQAEMQAEALKVQAEQQRTAAIQEQAMSQRKAIEAARKGSIMASRARAVMAASGGGVDEKLVSSLIGEGEYGKDVALFEGDERARTLRNQSKFTDFQSDLTRWSGAAGVTMAGADRAALQSKSAYTLLGSVASAGLGLAGKYGGTIGGGGTAGSPVSASSAISDFKNMPNSWRAPGLDDYQWDNGVV